MMTNEIIPPPQKKIPMHEIRLGCICGNKKLRLISKPFYIFECAYCKAKINIKQCLEGYPEVSMSIEGTYFRCSCWHSEFTIKEVAKSLTTVEYDIECTSCDILYKIEASHGQ